MARSPKPWRRRFPPTREGWWFIAATLVVGAAAVNGGINLLFLVFGMMLSLILASGVLSEQCLRGLTITRRPPASAHAGSAFLMGIAVRNGKRRLPTFSLEVEDLVDGKPVDRRCYFLKLPAGRQQETAYKHTLSRRGVHRLSGYRLTTRFPFGLIRKSREVEAPLEMVVYPALVPVAEALAKTGAAELGRRHTKARSRGGEFDGLREFRAGDDPRDIHWRTSARRGRPFVREAEEETGQTVVIVLEDREAVAGFEAAVSMAASLAVALLKHGLLVGLASAGQFLPPASGSPHAAAILRHLALVQPGKRNAAPPLARGVAVLRVVPTDGAPSVEHDERARRSA